MTYDPVNITPRPRCRVCQGPIDDDGECGCQECRTCLGVGGIRDGQTSDLRKCLDCNGAGTIVVSARGAKP